MMKRFNIFLFNMVLLLSMIFVSSQILAESKNYCHDEDANRDWENLAHNSTEPEIKELFSLRKDLCEKVDDGELELDTAIDIFETQRQIKIETLKQRKMQINKEPSYSG